MAIFGGYSAGLAPGEIMPVGKGSPIPPGFLLCDGAAISRTLYPELFAAIGTNYGAGDGSTTFNLPKGNIPFILNPLPISNNGQLTYINMRNDNNGSIYGAYASVPGWGSAPTDMYSNGGGNGYSNQIAVLDGIKVAALLIKYRW